MAEKPGGGVMAVRPGCSAGTLAGAALLSRLSSVLPESWDAASWAVCAPEPAQGEEALLCLFLLPFFLHALPLRFKVLSSAGTSSEAGSILCTSGPAITHPFRIVPGSAPLVVSWLIVVAVHPLLGGWARRWTAFAFVRPPVPAQQGLEDKDPCHPTAAPGPQGHDLGHEALADASCQDQGGDHSSSALIDQSLFLPAHRQLVGLDEQAALHQLAGDSMPWDRAHYPI
ncbi:MAG: hypothetical protein FRX49_09741 [Trebouxia sp. A1-2]|nr:MAG: hypothetical protein FRX49_09741 [Trebouxia sp. A1-2]